jgi:hypothetical protein
MCTAKEQKVEVSHSFPVPLHTYSFSHYQHHALRGPTVMVDESVLISQSLGFMVKASFLVLHILRVWTNLLTCSHCYIVILNNMHALKILYILPFHPYF